LKGALAPEVLLQNERDRQDNSIKLTEGGRYLMSNVTWLQDWYESMCNGEWEHQHGVHIGTLDNPGWSIRISLEGTALDESLLPADREGEDDWIVCRISDGHFEGFSGPRNLDELINAFRNALTPKTDKG
jgi:hypothetical protein